MEPLKVTEQGFEFAKMTEDEKKEYAYRILGTTDDFIYGKIIGENERSFQMIPYDVHGNAATLFLNQGRCKIGVNKKNNVKVNDFVRGRLDVIENKFYFLHEVKRLDTEEEFREKLYMNLKKKWQSEGFNFESGDFARFDGKMAFSFWVADKVEAMLEGKYEAFIQNKIKNKEQYIQGIDKDIEKKQAELKAINETCQEEKKIMLDLTKQVDKAKELYAHYLKLGIVSEDQCLVEKKKIYPYENYEALIDQVWGYLWKNKNLYYEKTTIRSFMNALRTKQLILLWGRPGTGKTSLPLKAAEALGAKCVRIQVQSNWTDNQDLLGFYNIVDNRYVSTQFLDALIEAEKNPEQLYFILLDEMNLSNVEYYFSEMLNVFTWDKPYELHLYSDRIQTRARDALKKAEQEGKALDDLVAQLADMAYYKPSFIIPKNIRFIGTLNTDATTKTISPKVIDRSCLIELQTISGDVKKIERESLPKVIQLDGNNVMVKVDPFDVVSSMETESDLLDTMDTIRELGLPVSNRVNQYISQWTGRDDTHVGLDEIVLEKILPSIDCEYSSQTKKTMSELKKILKDCERSQAKIKRMETHAKECDRMMYWED